MPIDEQLIIRPFDAAARDEHQRGEAAKLIFATVPPLLAAEPVIHAADLIARRGT